MDYSFYLLNNTPINEKLLKYGFKEKDNVYLLEKTLKNSDFVAKFQISAQGIFVKVFDKQIDDEFLPFNIKNKICPEKIEVELILNDIISNCFKQFNLRQDVIDFIKTRYEIDPEFPWIKYPNYCTFKTKKSKKWFAVLMDVSESKLGFLNENMTDILNVKINPDDVSELIDNKHFFPAYHMNKKMWLTAKLDKTSDFEKIKQLIVKSYNLVEK